MTSALDLLAGTWSGEGRGEYPTIEPFGYREQLTVTPVPGRPLAIWTSRTTDLATGEPRHAETGFLRVVEGGLELVLAHGFGITEIATGPAPVGGEVALDSLQLAGSPSAKTVEQVERRYAVEADTLRYRIAMAAVGVELTHHLEAQLVRT